MVFSVTNLRANTLCPYIEITSIMKFQTKKVIYLVCSLLSVTFSVLSMEQLQLLEIEETIYNHPYFHRKMDEKQAKSRVMDASEELDNLIFCPSDNGKKFDVTLIYAAHFGANAEKQVRTLKLHYNPELQRFESQGSSSFPSAFTLYGLTLNLEEWLKGFAIFKAAPIISESWKTRDDVFAIIAQENNKKEELAIIRREKVSSIMSVLNKVKDNPSKKVLSYNGIELSDLQEYGSENMRGTLNGDGYHNQHIFINYPAGYIRAAGNGYVLQEKIYDQLMDICKNCAL